ncbi:3-oxoacyl-ACP reductase FabG [Methylocystis sp. H62]|uniref:3-oxoacyl-ACP reductase FabG n=1 Tax=Methylocystis sp. H62 TaxID=2785789 RepID=UPI0018C2AFDB|nr:3-oxoacyl-ACP reductase FabG [Methylocystis sp. H62]MBG0793633.1 3-oxoacyl-ACP reductase FabG [Methylocystis sp. H62]
MLTSIADRSVIVTGGSRGIGRGIANVFAAKGAQVLVVGRDLAQAEATAAAIRAEGGRASGFAADVGDPGDVERMAAAALERHGGVDILCANAGVFPAARLMEMTLAQWNEVLSTNLAGAFLSVRACVPALARSGRGRIVLTSSITGPITGYPGWAHYAASKAGQLGFMRTAALELTPLGITINAVLPGNVRTEGLDELGEDYLAKMTASIPQRRLGSVEDIAYAALFFASDEAAYITGQTLVIDGGQVLPESLTALQEMDR